MPRSIYRRDGFVTFRILSACKTCATQRTGVLRRNGFGIARKSRLDVEADLREGTLVELLQEFSSGDTGLQIVYPATQTQPRRVRLLIERIAKVFSASDDRSG